MTSAETPAVTAEKPPEPPKPTITIKSITGDDVLTVEGESIQTASFYKCELPKADFKAQCVENVTFYNSNLEGSCFENANCERANFQVCNLQNANLKGANLNLANLIDADLRGANLSDSNFEFARAWGAKYNSTTQLPKGFKLEGSRLIYKD